MLLRICRKSGLAVSSHADLPISPAPHPIESAILSSMIALDRQASKIPELATLLFSIEAFCHSVGADTGAHSDSACLIPWFDEQWLFF